MCGFSIPQIFNIVPLGLICLC